MYCLYIVVHCTSCEAKLLTYGCIRQKRRTAFNLNLMIPIEILQAIEEYAENYTGSPHLRDSVVHAAVYGYTLAQQQLEEKDKEIASLKQRLE